MISLRKRDALITAGIVIAFLLLWEVASRSGILSRIFFTPPSVVAGALIEGFRSGSLLTDMALTVGRLTIGTVLGGSAALILGIAMGWSEQLRRITNPVIAIIHPIPKIALLPLAMLLLGIGEASKVFLIALSCFFPMIINTMEGVRQISPTYYEVAQNYGASRFQVLKRVILPASLPFILAGARLAINVALLITISLEIVASTAGLGNTIWFAWQTFKMERLFAALIVIAVLGFVINLLLEWVARRLMPWQRETTD
jgi:NitT/TauT family transport system permease protein